MEAKLHYRHRVITGSDVAFIRQLLREHPAASRRELSKKLCQAWNWVQPNGALRDMVCRGLMLKLHREGLICVDNGERLDDESIVQETLLILIGGDETTRHVITGGQLALFAHPDQHAVMRDEPGALQSGVEEMLRWVSPIKNMSRTVVHEVELRGETLHAGDQLILMYPSANRDPDEFPDPFTFDVRRDPNQHIAFGFGPHYCLGQALARLELNVMFDVLFQRLPDLEPAGGGPWALPTARLSIRFADGASRNAERGCNNYYAPVPAGPGNLRP